MVVLESAGDGQTLYSYSTIAGSTKTERILNE
jgi:hypothetical protein